MTDEQRAREVACDALVACCKLPSDTPVDQYHHEPECDALTAAILALIQEEREACVEIVRASRLGDDHEAHDQVAWGYAVGRSIRLCELVAEAIRIRTRTDTTEREDG